jgi:uncharacterized protein (TIGR02001 family)
MSIRFASAASAVALIASLSTPAFAGEMGEAGVGPALEITSAEANAANLAMRAMSAVDLAKASGAEDEQPAITVSGSATLTSDYRFRGVSQTDEGIALQGGFTIAHESGFYVSTWGSNLAGWGTFGGTNMELDLIAGYSFTAGNAAFDMGVTWFMYPSGADTTDFAELYASVSGDAGPISLTAGVAYAPSQEALGKVFLTGLAAAADFPDNPGDKEDNLYLYGDASYAIPNSPITLSAHLGYSDGNAGLGPNGTSIAPTGTYFDWSLSADIEVLPGLNLGIAYVDTDISASDGAYLLPNFSKLNGGQIADATIVFSITASF